LIEHKRKAVMRLTKSYVLVASAAAVLAVAAGASTASAAPGDTVLCKTTTMPCTDHYPVGTAFHMQLATGHKTLQAGFANITCQNETWAGKVETTTTPTIGINSLSVTGCASSIVTVLKRGSLQIHHEGEHKGNVTISGLEITVAVGSTSCVYGGTVSNGITMIGGNPASIITKETQIPKVAGGFLCANPARWTAHFEITSPKPVFVSTETL
jgi:autotransporter translocation and assembly factor TamB